MQTIYYSTSNFIRHEGNLVDLNEFRHKLAMAQEGSLAPQLDISSKKLVQEEKPSLTVLSPVKKRRTHRGERAAWVLDASASLGVVFMTLSFALQLLS